MNALDIPREDFWGVFKLNYDYRFFSVERVKLIKDVYYITSSIIENIKSREDYRISNQAMSNFHIRMQKYNETLLNLFDKFEQLYSNFRQSI